jgi:hypothetical protein
MEKDLPGDLQNSESGFLEAWTGYEVKAPFLAQSSRHMGPLRRL